MFNNDDDKLYVFDLVETWWFAELISFGEILSSAIRNWKSLILLENWCSVTIIRGLQFFVLFIRNTVPRS